MSSLLKIYGERNSNTNFLSRLICLNLDATEIAGTVPMGISQFANRLRYPALSELTKDLYFQLHFRKTLGWKHSSIRTDLSKFIDPTSPIYIITLTKNPYSWLLSLYRRPYHQYYQKELEFEEFLQTPWKTVKRENAPRYIKSPIELWNMKNRSYLQIANYDGLNITAEGIFRDPAAIIDLIAAKYSIRKKQPQFTNYDKSTKNDAKSFSDYQEYYLNEVWRSQLSTKALAIINNALDRSLLEYFGYELL